MPLIEWRDEFKTGIDSVDHEHRTLIQLINDLHTRLEGSPDESAILGFFGDLHAGISAHFALEERHMRERGYDQYDEHKSDHETLLDEIRDIMDAYAAGRYANYANRLSRRLRDWFVVHFQTKDARLHKYLRD